MPCNTGHEQRGIILPHLKQISRHLFFQQAVVRSVNEMRHLQQLDSRVKFSIVTDQPHEQSFINLGVNLIGTPASFRPPKALYKARALEWFRLQAKLDDNDWVLHLDKETIVDDHTIKACLKFAKTETEFDMGQVFSNISLLQNSC